VAHSNRGWFCCQAGHYDQAIADCTRAIQLDPAYALAYMNRAAAFGNNGRPAEAVADASRAIQLDPTTRAPTATALRLTFRRRQGAGHRRSQRGHPARPADWGTYYDRGVAYYDQRQYDRAIADFTQFMRGGVQGPALIERGRAYCMNGQFAQAIADLTAAQEQGTADARALSVIHSYRGLAYQQTDQHEQALADYTRAIEVNPDDWFAYHGRGPRTSCRAGTMPRSLT